MSIAATDGWPRSLPRFAVIGRSNSGKTTLLRQLIAALSARGIEVGTVKHATHPLALDAEGKDSWHHAAAGAGRVVVVGPGMSVAFIHRDAPTELAGWASTFEGHVDVVLIEGFERTQMPHVRVEVTDVRTPRLVPIRAAATSSPAWRLERPEAPLDRAAGFPPEIVAPLVDAIATAAWAARGGADRA